MEDIDLDLQRIIFEGLDTGKISKLDVKAKQRIIDNRTDKVAQMLALYPTTNTRKLAKMFNTSYEHIVKLAREAGIEKVERRGGHNRRRIEIVNLDGYVIKVFNSISELADFLGRKHGVIQNRIKTGKLCFIPGTIARLK